MACSRRLVAQADKGPEDLAGTSYEAPGTPSADGGRETVKGDETSQHWDDCRSIANTSADLRCMEMRDTESPDE